MEFQTRVESRRSIRSYKPDTTIDKNVLEEIIKTAQEAPSWKNSQVARYYVISTPEKLAQVKANCLPEFNQKNCADAPALIVTTFEKNRSGFERDGSATNEIGNEWGAYDLGLANAYLLLKAKEFGLDSLVMGIRNESALRNELDIPESQEVVSVISLGYANGESQRPPRKELDHVAKFF